ncbi:MAG TPA: SGNH/GDSL hydrolase family protein [Anaerolineales bacterium]|nr:SGNH/GDSL hydrolase family protein [Anaerolineales bacterium]
MKYTFLLCLILLAGCQTMPTEKTSGEEEMQTIRYLALGDSYTIGESVAENERWPNQLADLLRVDNFSTEVTIIARTGWTTDELWQGIQAGEINPPYDLVSLLIGVNNQYRGLDINEYREEFIFLLDKAIEYAGGDAMRVIVLSIPDWGVTPFAKSRDSKKIATEIDLFNSVNREEAKKAGVYYVDITPGSRAAVTDSALIAADGLHPSGKMYAEWAELAYPQVLKILEK